MTIPGRAARCAILLAAALTVASLAGCREKHEPTKPTVAAAAPAT